MANAILLVLGTRSHLRHQSRAGIEETSFGGIVRPVQCYNHATIQKKAFLAQFGISIWPRERKLLLEAIITLCLVAWLYKEGEKLTDALALFM